MVKDRGRRSKGPCMKSDQPQELFVQAKLRRAEGSAVQYLPALYCNDQSTCRGIEFGGLSGRAYSLHAAACHHTASVHILLYYGTEGCRPLFTLFFTFSPTRSTTVCVDMTLRAVEDLVILGATKAPVDFAVGSSSSSMLTTSCWCNSIARVLTTDKSAGQE